MTPRAVLGVAVRGAVQLGGGAARVDLADGRSVVVKAGQPTAVAAEAAGLRWLRVPGGPPVPAVLAVERDHLVMELVPAGTPSAAAAAAFGRRLAVLHATGAPAYGAAPPGGPAEAWIGRAPMRNIESASWPEWYAADRVLPYLRRAYDAGDLTAEETAAVEEVCDRLPELAGPTEPPARLHGDLWSGNAIVQSWLRGRLVDIARGRAHRCHLGCCRVLHDRAQADSARGRPRVPPGRRAAGVS